jgi:VIT1/CCC1 family predicted Fe2+/Mn2+ transporter
MITKVAEELTRGMKLVLGEAEASRGITEAGFKSRIDRLDERFGKFETRVSANELRVESCEVTMKLEKAATKPNVEAQALALASLEKSMFQTVAALERDLRDEIRNSSERSLYTVRKELEPVHDAIFGTSRHDDGVSPVHSPLSTPTKSSRMEVYSGSAHLGGGSLQARLATLARKQEEHGMIIQSMHQSMEWSQVRNASGASSGDFNCRRSY